MYARWSATGCSLDLRSGSNRSGADGVAGPGPVAGGDALGVSLCSPSLQLLFDAIEGCGPQGGAPGERTSSTRGSLQLVWRVGSHGLGSLWHWCLATRLS